jgi:DNA-binding CsgD family transcriptional regulator
VTKRTARTAQRAIDVAALAADGISAADIAAQLGCHIQTVYVLGREDGIAFKRPSSIKNASRTERMAHMSRQGLTLEKIGQQFKLTRERVRQILRKAGITADEGGAALTARVRKGHAQASAEARCMLKFGMPLAVVRQLRQDGVTLAFQSQEKSAGIRGIRWDLTFAEWFAIWQASGKLHLRGRGKGKYVMSRIRDDGPYQMGNVHIQLATENSREAVEKWRGKVKQNRGVFCLYPGRELAWLAQVGKVRLGFHRTEGEAVAARAAYLAANPQARGRGYALVKGVEGRADRFQVVVGRTYVGTYHSAEAAVAARAAFLNEREAA